MAEERVASVRLRRLRKTDSMRRLAGETTLSASNFIAPIFVREGSNVTEPIAAMPGVARHSVDRVGNYATRIAEAKVPAVLLFGIPGSKDEVGSGAYASDGVVPRAVRAIKRAAPDLVVAADVCLCEYTSHGHCGLLRDGGVDNDRTLPLLAKAAVEYAKAGADIVAPSAMMDFQVGAIRSGLDAAGLSDTLVMGYSAKYASSFYGPFREAAGSAPAFGDRRSYQMSPADARQAMREIDQDIREGADVVMVKPALSYLDIIAKARARFDMPIAAYNVSGEYSAVKAAAANGWADERAMALEILTSIRRAGADMIITYFAEAAAGWLKEGL